MTDYLTTRAVGVLLGISARRVLYLIAAGRLPACKLGKAYMVRREDVELVRVRIAGWPKGEARGPQSPEHMQKRMAKRRHATKQP
jgi:excisionase family DNA binding protein